MNVEGSVLIVDDNPINLAILEEMLCNKYSLLFAQNGCDAMKIAARRRPAAILLDVMMPEIDGLTICRHIRATSDMGCPVIIMVSAKAMPSERAAGIAAGANDYITKPFDEDEILTVLQRHLGSRDDTCTKLICGNPERQIISN